MRIEYGNMVALGYGKYFKSDSIIGLVPVVEERGPGNRTYVYVEQRPEPFVASRSEGAILRDMVESPGEITRTRKVRRKFIAEKYGNLIEALYDGTKDSVDVEAKITYEDGRTTTMKATLKVRDVETY